MSSAVKEVIGLALVHGDLNIILISVAWSLYITPGCAVVMMFGINCNEKEYYKQDK